ncbi:flap endonuclease [Actinomadura barringtoniae]|uniref:5'-3' exonuclease n=1 Tax=Actinomadura barringtoniae TaxID=1427535 RepID=A0A939PJD9_9ACTN|nr:5'-3' exonuclease H3TH domain-containing protein [Actinomadura barringtoniae]MBO2453377.1 flap endonuclease [Actinomadura barringtoniae]
MNVPLLLVDGNNLVFRAAHGFPTPILSRDQTRDLTGVFGFFAILRAAVRDELGAAPEVVVVFDGRNGSAARRAADPDYKANRPDDEEARRPLLALPDVKQGLELYGLDWIEIDDAEADDVIATLVHAAAGRDRLIMSMDKDFYQFLDLPGVRVLNTARRPGERVIGPEQVRARHGVDPAQWVCFRALSGDPSDNIPGVMGIGPKTAAKLLAGGLSVHDLPASGRLTGAKGRRVQEDFEQLLAWRALIEARIDVPLPRVLTGLPSPTLPSPAEIIDKLDLW